jgi:hypothetical protein
MRAVALRIVCAVLLLGLPVICGAGTLANEVNFRTSTSFVVGAAVFPAGGYAITGDPDDPMSLLVTSDDHAHAVWVQAEPLDADSPRAKTEVIFNKYGDTMVLKQIWVQGQTSGYLLITGHAERKAAKAGPPTKQSLPATAKRPS